MRQRADKIAHGRSTRAWLAGVNTVVPIPTQVVVLLVSGRQRRGVRSGPRCLLQLLQAF